MYKISPELLQAIVRSGEIDNPSNIAHSSTLDIKVVRKVLNQEHVHLRSLAKIAILFNFDFDKSYIIDGTGKNMEAVSSGFYLEDIDLFDALVHKINKLTELLKLSRVKFFRTRIEPTCTYETFRTAIKNNKISVKKYEQLIKKIDELEIISTSKD
jgi:hypothetical protein